MRTRRSVAQSPSSSESISTTMVSPLFSNRTSKISASDTSDGEQEVVKKMPKRVTRSRAATVAASKSKKRAAQSDEESEQGPATSKRPTKRRAVAMSSVVEVVIETKAQSKSAPSGASNTAASAVDDETAATEQEDANELETIDESSDSGSEFEQETSLSEDEEDEEDFDGKPSGRGSGRRSTRRTKVVEDEDEEAVEDFGLNESEEEEVMVDAAIQASLQSARARGINGSSGSGSGAGSSTPASKGRKPRAALLAAAAERRLARAHGRDYEGEDDDTAELAWGNVEQADEPESEEEPLATKGKGKGKGKGTGKAKAVGKGKGKVMTITEMKQKRREERKAARAERDEIRAEERKLREKLGRKLTPAEKSTIALYKNHPELKDVWGNLERKIVIVKPEIADPPANLKATLLPFQKESLFWMRKQEQGPNEGGILADEMGMGKTIQIISLLTSDMQKPNLVVAPTVALVQWKNEIELHAEGLKVLMWYGSSRVLDSKELKKYHVVLTTYAVLESSFRKQQSGFKRQGQIIKEKSVLHAVEWHRVVLDEAHNIKERSTNTAKATFELTAKYKWCLSGTPLQNRVGELYSLIRFLGGDPFAYYFCKRCDCKSLHWKFSNKRTCDDCGHTPMHHTCFWNNEVLSPIQKCGMMGPGAIAFKKLRVLLDRIMLRRTKIERADDLGLPPRTVLVRRDYFSPEEKELYLSLFSDAKRQFSTYVDSGTILNNYSNIFSLLTRMRQMACHPDLVIRSKNNVGKFNVEDEGDVTVCRICNDIAEDAIMSKCRHIFDRECIKQYLNTAVEMAPECPICHVPLTIDLEAESLELEQAPNTRQGILGRLNLETWRSSTKIEALVEELSSLRKQDATVKSLVFSQFVNFLDLIAFRLQKAGFTVCRLEGTMSPQARNATIQHFMNNVHVTVFLVSLKAGGVALNLTEASRVYLMDSWWNPAVEYQAMDRIHRLGQHRPVQAIKLVVEDSIESRIIQLQEKKSAMVDATLSTDDSAMGRLTPEDLGFLFRL